MRYKPDATHYEPSIRPCARKTFDRRPRFFEPDSKQWWRDGKVPCRDSFKSRSYRAENKFIRQDYTVSGFGTIYEASIYVRATMESAWFQRRFPRFHSCWVQQQTRGQTCWGRPLGTAQGEVTRGQISLSRWGLNLGPILILHELTHAILPPEHGHDRRWARTYIELVRYRLGADAGATLQQHFRDEGLKLSPFRRHALPSTSQKVQCPSPQIVSLAG